MASVEPLELRIDVERFTDIVDPILKKNRIEDELQIQLRHMPGELQEHYTKRFTWGSGSLWDEEKREMWAQTSDFSELQAELKGTYVEDVIEMVQAVSPKNLGRVRLLTLLPKTCYSLHRDPEEFRYHIPLETSLGSFFISGGEFVRMEEPGRLYTFKTNQFHTAVNAHKHDKRRHLVFDVA